MLLICHSVRAVIRFFVDGTESRWNLHLMFFVNQEPLDWYVHFEHEIRLNVCYLSKNRFQIICNPIFNFIEMTRQIIDHFGPMEVDSRIKLNVKNTLLKGT